MLLALRAHCRDLLHGLWFVPGLVILGFVVLAVGLLSIDRHGGTSGFEFLFSGSGSAARSVLTQVSAGAFIGIFGAGARA